MIWRDLLGDIRTRLDEPDPGFWTDDELKFWANEGLRDACRRLELLRSQKSYDTVPEQGEFPMPEDMLRVYRLEYRRSSTYIIPLEYAQLNRMDDVWGVTRVSSSTPYFYTTDGYPGGGGKFIVYPSLSETLTDGIRAYYYRLPRPIVDLEDPVDIHSGWEDLISLYVEWNARRKEAQDQRWREALQLYEAKLEEMRKVTRTDTDQANYMSGNRLNIAMPWWVGSGDDWWGG